MCACQVLLPCSSLFVPIRHTLCDRYPAPHKPSYESLISHQFFIVSQLFLFLFQARQTENSSMPLFSRKSPSVSGTPVCTEENDTAPLAQDTDGMQRFTATGRPYDIFLHCPSFSLSLSKIHPQTQPLPLPTTAAVLTPYRISKNKESHAIMIT